MPISPCTKHLNHASTCKNDAHLQHAPVSSSASDVSLLNMKDLDAVLRFINGGDEDSEANKKSSKAAKRARQKQRKVRHVATSCSSF